MVVAILFSLILGNASTEKSSSSECGRGQYEKHSLGQNETRRES